MNFQKKNRQQRDFSDCSWCTRNVGIYLQESRKRAHARYGDRESKLTLEKGLGFLGLVWLVF
jgi:hypothetical protein